MAGRFTKGTLTVSMIAGTVLVPLSALAAIWLTGTDEGVDGSAATTTTFAAASTAPSTPGTTAVVTTADLEAACGPEGMQLAALEEQGTISDVQQAALDALRDLCAQQDLPLPSAPVSEPIVQTVVVPAPSTATTVAGTTATTHDDDYDDYDYEDEDEDHEDHEDDEYEDDHEDEDHEDHEDND